MPHTHGSVLDGRPRPQTIEIIDDDDVVPLPLHDTTTNTGDLTIRQTSPVQGLARHRAETTTQPAIVQRKRRWSKTLSPGADDVQVISERPGSSAKHTHQRPEYIPEHRRKRASQENSRPRDSTSYVDAIDLDALPDVRPRSPARAYPGQGYTNYGTLGNTRQNYGSANRPIDVDSYDNGGEGPSRPQMVNGSAVGTFQNGRYVPYVPQQPHSAFPYTVPGLGPFGRAQSGLSNLYDRIFGNERRSQPGVGGQVGSSGQMNYLGYQGRYGQGHPLQGHTPLPANAYGINAYSRQAVPNQYHTHRNEFDRYHDAYAQNQISAEDLNNLLANIADTDIPPEERVANPVGLTKSLMEHQRVGLTWLLSTEAGSNKGGILADAMGLGKTIQAISLILSRPSEVSDCKTTLVVAPVALLRQWEREIRHMTFPRPKTYIHHGPKKLSLSKDITKFDIVLTSFNTVGYEEGARVRYDEQCEKVANPGEPPVCPILDTKWHRIILDEAHYIKNKATKGAQGCCKLQAQFRWALTGTPMQNSVDELYSLILFLRIKPYNDYKSFTQDIAKPLTSKNPEVVKKATKKIQALLTAIMLRRTKDSQIDGKAILQLPAKHSIVDEVTMGDDERARYTELESGIKKTLKRVMEHDKNATGTNMLVLLLKLRQTCNHFLLSGKDEKDITVLTKAEGIKLAKTLTSHVVDRLKTSFSEGTECSLCLDVVTTGITILVPCGHYYCGECLLQEMEFRAAQDTEDSATRCPQCRTPYQLKKCINLKHFRAAHCPEQFNDPPRFTDDDDDEVSSSDFPSAGTTSRDSKASTPQYHLNILDKGKSKQRPFKRHASLYSSSASSHHDDHHISERFSAKYDLPLNEFTSSAKIDTILRLLQDVQAHSPGEKTIVFSQFTSFLDLVEIPLHRHAVRFLRYDGSLSAEQRNSALVQFEEDPQVNVLLVSLKAGNVGLNLTCANHVVVSEPFWNPYVEDQAVDRAHRIGQGKEVFVHRLIIKDSVESRVLAIQERKRALVEGAMDPSQSAAITKLGKREIAYLFGLGSL